MTENEINQLIDAEFKIWNDTLFDLEPLPKDFIERFKIAMFKVPESVHRLSHDTINRIINKKVSELTNYEIPVILNAIHALPLCEYSKTLEEGLAKKKRLEEIKVGYTLMVQKLNYEMDAKRKNMLALSNPTKQPLKLVKAQA